MTAALLASCLLGLGLGSGPAVSGEAALQATAGLRTLLPASGPDRSAPSVEVQPRLGVTVDAPAAELTLAYLPLFTWVDDPGAARRTWLHLASLAGSARLAPAWTGRGQLQASLGTSDLLTSPTLLTAAGQPPPVAQRAPTGSTLDSRRATVELGLDGQLDPRLDLRSTLGAAREGGVDAADLLLLPLQQSGHGSAALDWRASHTDALRGTLTGQATHYFDVPVSAGDPALEPTAASWTTWISTLTGGWSHDLARDTRGLLDAGLALTGGDGPGQAALRAVPAASLGLEHAPPPEAARLSGGLVVALAPVSDRLGGLVQERVDLRAHAAWSPAPRWALLASLSGGVVVDGASRGDRLGFAEARLGWTVVDDLELFAALRGSAQDQHQPVAARTAEWSASLGAAVAHRGQRARSGW